ncbi:MAG: hypothetical protein CMM94_07770 [Rickettsiales bacterium]|nr:hypothetical protein [Rickettsiales bacterium]
MRLWPDKHPRRSQLFMPADKPHMVRNAVGSDADCIILDLEDAVAEDSKDNARATLLAILDNTDFGNKEVIVRINGATTPHYQKDVDAIKNHPKVNAILLPKVEKSEQISDLHLAAPKKDLWLLFESAKGVLDMRTILERNTHAGIKALCFGNNDFSEEMGLSSSHEMNHARSKVILAARAHGLMVFDGPSQRLIDNQDPAASQELQQQSQHAFDLGFDGKMAIHPQQVKYVNRAFTPSEKAVKRAERIVEAHDGTQGAIRVDGEMVEALHVRQAQELLEINKAIKSKAKSVELA